MTYMYIVTNHQFRHITSVFLRGRRRLHGILINLVGYLLYLRQQLFEA